MTNTSTTTTTDGDSVTPQETTQKRSGDEANITTRDETITKKSRQTNNDHDNVKQITEQLDKELSSEDLETTIRTIEKLSELPYDVYRSYQRLRPLRKVIHTILNKTNASMFGGTGDRRAYVADKGEKSYLKGLKAKATRQQRNYLDKTILRKGRIDRLNALKESAKEEECNKLNMLVPDGVPLLNGQEANFINCKKLLTTGSDDPAHGEGPSSQILLPKARSCYICKVRYNKLHMFYDQLCPSCAELNFHKRNFSVDMKGRVAVVTGARVKIGFQTCLKLLRAGCTVIATTRFPNAACAAYTVQPDFANFRDRLHVYGLDLRDVTGVEAFTMFIKKHYEKIDVLINNACQTIRRPVGYYRQAVLEEQRLHAKASLEHHQLLAGSEKYEAARITIANCKGDLLEGEKKSASIQTHTSEIDSDSMCSLFSSSSQFKDGQNKLPKGVSYSTRMSQIALLPEDVGIDKEIIPEGLTDVNGQQLDLRRHNSWLLKMDEVSTPEIVETMFINAIGPFVLNSRLKPLMMHGGEDRPDRYIINVSAMEGKFYRYKTPNHPHTNMAKAALNMMTRTSAEDLAKNCRIFMNSVDTGWINDENPLERANKTAKENHFQTPIDEIDAAARILDPIFTGVSEGKKQYGLFLKDYKETEW